MGPTDTTDCVHRSPEARLEHARRCNTYNTCVRPRPTLSAVSLGSSNKDSFNFQSDSFVEGRAGRHSEWGRMGRLASWVDASSFVVFEELGEW